MKLFAILSLLFVTTFSFSQNTHTWLPEQLLATQDLAIKIKLNSKDKPLIFNVGPMENIKGAVSVGNGNAVTFSHKMETELSMESKTKPIVIYCGCCSYSNCPNIKPAYDALQKMGFKNTKVLELPENLKTDWVSKGYPMDK
ncbi:MAG: rhodanese-like domain-containing protein [Bacteroidia bacterium]|nr:rhodanese-like domain-containing protein [Bacteroidia bacterium]